MRDIGKAYEITGIRLTKLLREHGNAPFASGDLVGDDEGGKTVSRDSELPVPVHSGDGLSTLNLLCSGSKPMSSTHGTVVF